MNELDTALVALRENKEDPKCQSKYYDLFLNTTFLVPTWVGQEGDDTPKPEEGESVPLVLESEGNDYLMLFDTKERLIAWAQREVPSVEVPGHVLAATSMPPLHWALNVGSEYAKPFFPEEIAWLREVVQACETEAAKEAAAE